MMEEKRGHSISHPAELKDYEQYTRKQETDRAFHTLEGILRGINIDNKINPIEVVNLKSWCDEYTRFISTPLFYDAISFVNSVVEDNIVTQEEYEDLKWVCKNINTPNKYYDVVTSDIQKLQGILHGILADGVVKKEELEGLRKWIGDNSDLIGYYPYDEIEALIYAILDDGKVTEEEQSLLKVYFSQFVEMSHTAIDSEELKRLKQSISIPLICTMSPEVVFNGKLFCFTGISSKGKRIDVAEKIVSLGGTYNDTLTQKTDYLVVGDKNNPCWVFSCYGRKIEAAIENRKTGLPIQIVKEVDFWDATY